MLISLDLLIQSLHDHFVKKEFNQSGRRFEKSNSNFKPRRPRQCPDVARDAAARLVWQVLEEKHTLDEIMEQEETFANLSGRDRGFAAAITKETIRHLGHIDIIIAQHLQKPLPETAFYARALLRTGVAQFLADLAPAHAIIDRAVELAKSDKVAFGMKGLINAVLRKCIVVEQKQIIDDIELLPLYWRNRYINFYGIEKTQKIAASQKIQAPIDLTLKPNLDEKIRENIKYEFNGEYIDETTLRIKNLPDEFAHIEAWEDGLLWVQDYAASLPAKLLKIKPQENVLDMCSAPGGKAMQMAASGANLTAIDLSPERLELVKENFRRTNLNAEFITGDAKKNIGDTLYDKILLDAPCSATGTIRRNLESLWIKSPLELPKLMEIQCELIRTAAKSLKNGGTLVYAICSMEPEEADMAISAALEEGLTLDPILPNELPNLTDAIEARGTLRILPFMLENIGGLDGFFIARFVK